MTSKSAILKIMAAIVDYISVILTNLFAVTRTLMFSHTKSYEPVKKAGTACGFLNSKIKDHVGGRQTSLKLYVKINGPS